MTWWQAVLVALSSVVATLGTLGVAKITGKASKQAAQITADAQEKASESAGYHLLFNDMQTELQRLRSDVDDLRLWRRDAEHEIAGLKAERGKHRALIRRLWDHLQAALIEIKRLGGTPPPDVYRDAETVRLILDADSP